MLVADGIKLVQTPFMGLSSIENAPEFSGPKIPKGNVPLLNHDLSVYGWWRKRFIAEKKIPDYQASLHELEASGVEVVEYKVRRNGWTPKRLEIISSHINGEVTMGEYLESDKRSQKVDSAIEFTLMGLHDYVMNRSLEYTVGDIASPRQFITSSEAEFKFVDLEGMFLPRDDENYASGLYKLYNLSRFLILQNVAADVAKETSKEAIRTLKRSGLSAYLPLLQSDEELEVGELPTADNYFFSPGRTFWGVDALDKPVIDKRLEKLAA